MAMINRAYIEVMTTGDAQGRVFTFPIPTYNITPDFDWNGENTDILFEMAAKYGLPYFQNFLNSDLKPTDVRSMCPLHPDTKILLRSSKGTNLRPISEAHNDWKYKNSEYEVFHQGKWHKASFVAVPTTEQIEIELLNGTKVILDPRHEQPTWNPKTQEAITLKIGDNLTETDWLPFGTTSTNEEKPEEYLAGFAIGAFMGDGTESDDEVTYSLSTTEKKQEAKSLLSKFWSTMGLNTATSQNGELISLRVSSEGNLAKTFIRRFVSGKSGQEKHLLKTNWKRSQSFLQGVLDGWLATDGGNRGRIYSTSIQAGEDFSHLCSLLGRLYNLDNTGDQREGRLSESPVYCYKVHNRSSYGEAFQSAFGYKWVPIKKITRQRVSSTFFCAQITEEPHLFQLANGLVTHNCRLRLDKRELLKRGNGLFGSAEKTGSVGVVTINLARLGYKHKGNKTALFAEIDELAELAKHTLETKRKFCQSRMDAGFYPFSKRYLGSLKNHFSTIGINGANEMIRNFTEDKENIISDAGKALAEEVLHHLREKMVAFQAETGNLYNLEATPAEGATYRFAREDQKRFPGILQAGTSDAPYYTNSTQLPVGYTNDAFEALDHQELLQTLYTGGTVLHLYMGERISSADTCRKLIRTVLENYRVPYITISPTFSICEAHGYITGEHPTCPTCGNHTEVWSRVMGYHRPISQWNKGKQSEHKERTHFVEAQCTTHLPAA
jgi:hypothetical protein